MTKTNIFAPPSGNFDNYQGTYIFLKDKLRSGFRIYNYDRDELSNYYNTFFDFVYNDLGKWNDFDIDPCYFYYVEEGLLDNKPAKAYAERTETFNVIGINYRLFKKIRTSINSFFEKRSDISSKVFLNLDEFCNLSPCDIVCQASLQFIYFHELGHIIQKSNGLGLISEENKVNIDPADVIKSHVMETDADLFATNALSDHIIRIWKEASRSENSLKILEDIICLYELGIFLTFDYLSNGIRPIHFLETSHPHPICRITSINGGLTMRFKVNGSMDINVQKIKSKLYKLLLVLEDGKFAREYLEPLIGDHKQIYTYSQNIMREGHNFPNLASFKLLKRKSKS